MFFNAKTEADIDNLITSGADINAQDSFFGQTYLHILVQSSCSLFDYFLTKGPDTNIQNKTGKTPIYYAKNITTIEKLIKHGATILVKDINGQTPCDTNYQISNYITYYANNIKNKLVA